MLHVFDTDIHIKYRPLITFRGSLISAIVLHELVAGAADDSEIQLVEVLRMKANAENRILTPTMIDWWEAGKILYRLRQGKKLALKV